MKTSRIIRSLVAASSLAAVGVSGCDEGHHPREASEAGGIELRDVPLTVTALRDDGFTAAMVVDGESIEVNATSIGSITRVTVVGEQAYADWIVDFDAREGSGEVAGVPAEENDPARWKAIEQQRASAVLSALSVDASGLMADHYGLTGEPDDLDEPPPAPGSDALLDGLRLLGTLSAFVHSRTVDDLTAAPPAPEAITPGVDDLAGDVDVASDGSCYSQWTCDVSIAMGCVGTSSAGPAWWKVISCGWSVLSGCGFLCAQTNYAEYWAGNCLYGVSAYANHSNAIYCVGGGCSTCY